jgi:hypothetical protein
MPMPTFSALLGYFVSAVTLTVGMLVLWGLFLPATTPGQVRVTFGVVILLLGIYRASITYVRSIQAKRKQHE